MAEYDFIKMQKKLAKYLDEDRYEHTLGVMFTCAALAMVHDCDLITAQTAGLLHDCAASIIFRYLNSNRSILFYFMPSLELT